MHDLPVAWRVATSALLFLLLVGHHVTRAVNVTTEVNKTLVMEYSLTVIPETKVKYGSPVTLTCKLHIKEVMKFAVYHLWLYQKSLPVRMAAFHPASQDLSQADYPRELLAHPDVRCFDTNSKNCSGRSMNFSGRSINNLDGTQTFYLDVTFNQAVCCDNDEYYCWFFVYSDFMPAAGFNSTSKRVSMDCHKKVLARRCYLPLSRLPSQDKTTSNVTSKRVT